MIRIALLGCGRMGKTHAKTLSCIKHAKLLAVHDALPEAAAKLSQEYAVQVLDYQEILHHASLDAVILCTPSELHAEQIEDFVKQKIAVFCEKPISLLSQRVRDCLQVVEQHQGRLMLGFNRRFDSNFQALKSCLKDGRIGKPEIVQITSRDPAPPPLGYIKTSGGLFKDMMIHDFDMAHFLLEQPFVRISASGSCLVDSAIAELGDIDTASVTMQTEEGSLVLITNSRRASYGYDQRIEVHGSQGTLKVENQHDNTLSIGNNQGFCSAPYQNFFMERYEQAYQTEIAYFIDCLEHNRGISPNGEDGLRSLVYAEAAQQAMQSGKFVLLD